MSCVQCHDPHGGDILNRRAGSPWRGGIKAARMSSRSDAPFVFEHKAMREGCTSVTAARLDQPEMLIESDPTSASLPRAGSGANVPRGRIFIGNVDTLGS